MNPLKFRGYKLFYQSLESAESMLRQIEEFPSFFSPTAERPIIIDCGANIGISVLEWKYRWPASRIICFEPDPHAFAVLNKNIVVNDVPDVRCIQAALSNVKGQTNLFGNIDQRGDARGNSIDPGWGQRDGSSEVLVATARLGSYINQEPVDFLKIDIEGAEFAVLSDIQDKLQLVKAIYVEVHETSSTKSYNSLELVERILLNAEFTIEVDRRDEAHALPPAARKWQESVGARQAHIMGWR